MENRLIDIKEVARITGLGRSTIYKKIKTGEFLPGVVKFNRHRWWLHEVMQFMGGDVTVNIAAPPAKKPPRVKLAKHRAQLKKLSAEKPKPPPIHLEVSKNPGVSSNPHHKLQAKELTSSSPLRRSA